MFQNEQLEESKVLYEKLIRKFPQNFEAKGQYVSLILLFIMRHKLKLGIIQLNLFRKSSVAAAI